MKKISFLIYNICALSCYTHCLFDTITKNTIINNYAVASPLKAQGSLIFNFDVKPAFLAFDGFHYDLIQEEEFDIFGSQDDELISAFHYTLIALQQGVTNKPLGTAQFFIFDTKTTSCSQEKIGLIKKIITQNDSYSHRFTSFILETAIQFLTLKKCTTIIIDLVDNQGVASTALQKALTFYKQHGFTELPHSESTNVRLVYTMQQTTSHFANAYKCDVMAQQLLRIEQQMNIKSY